MPLNSVWGFRQKNVANPFLLLQGKPWESKQTECKVNTIMHKPSMWSASDQLWEQLSARGMDGSAHLKSSEYKKRMEADMLKSVVKITNMLLQVLRMTQTFF